MISDGEPERVGKGSFLKTARTAQADHGDLGARGGPVEVLEIRHRRVFTRPAAWLHSAKAPPAFRSNSNAELLASVDEYLRGCFRDQSPPRVSELARFFGMPLTTFVGKFHSIAGRAPSDYLKARQIDAAVPLLLRTDLSVAAVGYATGFGTRRSFDSQFQKHTGKTPDSFRNCAQNFHVGLTGRKRGLH